MRTRSRRAPSGARAKIGKSPWLFGVGLALTLWSCSDDKEDNAPPDAGPSFTEIDDDAGHDPLDSGVEEKDAGTGGGDSSASSDAEVDAGDAPQASAAEAKAQGWVEGCYKKPTSSAELLNSCATGWRTFDKSLYPSSWKEGRALPTLP